MKRLLAAAWLALATPAAAQQATPLFAADTPIHLTITAPLQQLMRNRESHQQLPGTLAADDGQLLPVTLKLRGITRRTAEVCEFAPLRIDFTGKPPANSLFAGQNKLKLVTHCRNTPAFQQHLLLEYAAYRMFNQLGPRSFRVRLAQIDYRDSAGRPSLTRAGFLIEDLGDVARRNGTRETRAGERIPVADLSPLEAARYGLFQHMIANHDWSMRAGPAGDNCCHNAELIGPLGPGSVIPLPYDFDFSGLVGAPYATPPDVLGISDVRQRLYRGYCLHNGAALAAAREMRAQRPQMLGVLAQVPGLAPATQARATAFLERFFADIATDDGVAKTVKRCIG
ncbi:MAG: hypothetical protein ABIS38_00870 [Sphingomicrobium sp.]